MKKIIINIIPHKDQEYETFGNWKWSEERNLEIFVSDLGNPFYNWFVAEHEINEALMCLKEGIPEKIVTAFDIDFERLRERFPKLIGEQEPGNMVSAPYNKQHTRASQIEELTCSLFGCSWDDYNKSFDDIL